MLSKPETSDYTMDITAEYYSAVVQENPHSCVVFDANFNLIDCNERAVQFYGFSSKEDCLQNFIERNNAGLPPFQPSGEPSMPIQDRLRWVSKHGDWETEIELYIGGELKVIDCCFKCLKVAGEIFYAVYIIDLTAIKEARNELIRRSRLLNAINTASSKLMSAEHSQFEVAVFEALQCIGRTINVDRMYVWENYEENGDRIMSQTYEWSEGAEPQQGKEVVTQRYADAQYWDQMLSNRKTINSIVADLPPLERAVLEEQDVRSVLVIPIFFHDFFWGFIGFDDCHNKRIFAELEESILKSAGFLIASAIVRDRMTEELIEAKEKAMAGTAAKSAFLSRMSHEIRTPMNAIIGMTNVAKKSGDIKKIHECLDKVDDSSRQLLNIINDVLDMSKIESGKLEIHVEPFDFDKMLKNVVSVGGVRFTEKRQKFILEYPSSFKRMVVSDELRLSQVLINLLSNANKFTPEGGSISLSISEKPLSEKTSRLFFAVTDSGIGISGEQKEKLFRSFEQADSGIARRFGGTGLGLAISKEIVTLLGGEIGVESQPDKGSRFYFFVDIEWSPFPYRYCREEKLLDAPDESLLAGKVIMVVDDIGINREIMKSLIEPFGVTVLTAADGREAVQLFTAREDIDLILMDMQMPVMDGLTATRKIRGLSHEKAKSVPIVAMTANAFKEDARACIDAGMNDHIAKPVEENVLITVLTKYLR